MPIVSGSTNTRTADNILSCLTNPAYGRLPMFSTVNKVLEDSTVSSFDVVTGPATAVVNNIAVFSSTSGKAITTATSGIGTIGALTLANTTGLGVNEKGYFNSNVVIGPPQTIILDHMLTLRGVGGALTAPIMAAYVSTSQYPIYQQLNWLSDNIAQSFDGYWDNVSWRSSNASSNYQLYKISNQFQFNYNATPTAAGSPITWSTAGYLDTSGILNWNKTIKTADTTDASSTTTGSLRTAGGLGVAKKVYVGDSVFVNTTSAVAKVVVQGGVSNGLTGEESIIRAISTTAATSAKIEIQNTAATGGEIMGVEIIKYWTI